MKILDIGKPFRMEVADRIFAPWHPELPEVTKIAEAEAMIDDIDLVCFGGGADIHPSIYGQINVASYGVSQWPSARDLFEIEIWKLAVEHKKPILGICRGAQLACALSGGQLIQDVSGHAGVSHKLTTIDNREMLMTSAHHQMMWPFTCKHEMIAWTSNRSQVAHVDVTVMNDPSVPINKEPEIVFFPQSKALAIQGHPEYYANPNVPPVVYTRELVEKYLGVHP